MPFLREAHVEACIAAGAAAVILFFGFAPRAVSRLRDAGVLVLHQIGTAAQARRAIADGADALIAQGREAGGHLLGTRGAPSFSPGPRSRERKAGPPSGGITDAADVRAAMGGGATGVLCGSRFLLTDECRAHPGYKRRVLGAQHTIETELFGFGWPARHRVVPNAATDRWCSSAGFIPASLRALQRATTLLGRVAPITFAATLSRAQRAAIPLFGPAPALEGAEDRALDATPLYAGTSVARVGSILPAERAVRDLFPGRRDGASPRDVGDDGDRRAMPDGLLADAPEVERVQRVVHRGKAEAVAAGLDRDPEGRTGGRRFDRELRDEPPPGVNSTISLCPFGSGLGLTASPCAETRSPLGARTSPSGP